MICNETITCIEPHYFKIDHFKPISIKLINHKNDLIKPITK